MGADRSPDLDEGLEDTTFCARHPQVETYLRCGRCETPICPRCLVQTPVGARCRECANVRMLPTFQVSPVYFARAQAAALVSGIVCGAIWAYLLPSFFGLIIGFGLGWTVSESVSLATNRKRGLGLQISAVMGVALAFLFADFLSPTNLVMNFVREAFIPRYTGPPYLDGFFDVGSAGIGACYAAWRLRELR